MLYYYVVSNQFLQLVLVFDSSNKMLYFFLFKEFKLKLLNSDLVISKHHQCVEIIREIENDRGKGEERNKSEV